LFDLKSETVTVSEVGKISFYGRVYLLLGSNELTQRYALYRIPSCQFRKAII